MERIFGSWRTSSVGVIGTAIAAYLFKSLGCSLPTDWLTWGVAAIPAIIGIAIKEKQPTDLSKTTV